MVPTADISTVIVDKPQKAVLLLEHVERKDTPGLKLVLLMEPFEEALKERGRKCGVVIKSMQDVEVRTCFWAVCWLATHSDLLVTGPSRVPMWPLFWSSKDMNVTIGQALQGVREDGLLPVPMNVLYKKALWLAWLLAPSPSFGGDDASLGSAHTLLSSPFAAHL